MSIHEQRKQERALVEAALREAPQEAGRRRFFVSAAAFGAAATTSLPIAAQTPAPAAGAPATPATPAAPPRKVFVKSDGRLLNIGATVRSGNFWNFSTYITPIEEFFIRNHYPTPLVEEKPVLDPKNWKLKVHGNAVDRPIEITYDQLLKMPSRAIIATMECHGNGRTLFWEKLDMKEVGGGNWGLGAIGNAEWQYVPISHILGLVGLKRGARSALIWSGVDGAGDIGRPIPVSELMERGDDIGLAFKMNGSDLLPDHGAPVRLLVPGWGGTASIKWITEIKIDDRQHWARVNTQGEAYIGQSYPVPAHSPDDFFIGKITAADIKGPMVTWMPIKSLITVPLVLEKSPSIPANYPLKRGEWPQLKAGNQVMQGYAWAPQHGVRMVQYRIDNGGWQRAQIYGPEMGKYTWVRFQFPWEATAGDHTIETRGIDTRGNVQPDTVPLNLLGMANSATPIFKIRVVA